MINQKPLSIVLLLTLMSSTGAAQIISKTTNVGPEVSIGSSIADETTYRLWQAGSDIQYRSPLESPGGSVSALDLKAPGKARKEFDKGYQLMMRKDLQGAINHLTIAISIYPGFVAAHSALGSAYLSLKQSDRARAEFIQAISLDDHLPGSYLNLACAELALKNFSAAEEATRKASNMAPLDLHMLSALAYGEFMNNNYQAAVTTAQQVHARQHNGFAKVHLYAAAALQAQNDIPKAEQELETFLREDPKSPIADRATQMLQSLKDDPGPASTPPPEFKISFTPASIDEPSGPKQLPEVFQRIMQASKENQQIEEAEAEAACPNCDSIASSGPAAPGVPQYPLTRHSRNMSPGAYTLHASANEVAVFFAATDRGHPVTNLTGDNVTLRDNSRPPAVVTGFLNQSQLPLRLGIVIDTSSSVADRFKFEQDAAIEFLRNVVTGQTDLAFVIGVANSVVLVQDFTDDQERISRAIGQLAPSGGTALWDAVAFAADKLASRKENKPVARLLVVISDGQNNSGSATLKEAIEQAQRGEVFIYTVNTHESTGEPDVSFSVGQHALKTLAELTGGASFDPGSVHRLNGSLGDLQQVIRSRYLISYKPAQFKRDGQYRTIAITAQKDGHKLRVYSRKGYVASWDSATSR